MDSPKHHTNFFGNLRSYPKSPIYQKKNKDTLLMSQNIIKKEYIPLLNSTSKKQRLLSAYLSKPKYITQKFDN